MPRDTPAPLTAMQKVQLASACQKLKLDTAKARQVEEVEEFEEFEEFVSASDIKLNQFGRAIVGYEDMPELEEADAELAETRESLDRRFEAKGARTWEHIYGEPI